MEKSLVVFFQPMLRVQTIAGSSVLLIERIPTYMLLVTLFQHQVPATVLRTTYIHYVPYSTYILTRASVKAVMAIGQNSRVGMIGATMIGSVDYFLVGP